LNSNTTRALEFDKICALLLMHAGSGEGRSRLEALQPLREPAAVREALATTTEAVMLLEAIGRQPYHDLPEIGAQVAASRAAGSYLDPAGLLDVASFIEGGAEVARQVGSVAAATRLARLASQVHDLSDVAAAIRHAILPSREVADHASSKLAATRRALVQLKVRLTSVMESFLRGKEAERLLQDKLVTTRNDRYVLLLKAEHRGQIPGVVHGSSGSGASLFVEPLAAVELNNDIVQLQDEERREVVRILQELTARVGARGEELALSAAALGELDAAQAKALLAREMECCAPEVVSEARVELLDARHPLLLPRLAERLGLAPRARGVPVPVTIRIAPTSPVLVVSGPNTGGKTVALKTAGLLALMAQCGLHVPAGRGSVLPAFRRIYADIGDEQSIGANLSTFSAHLAAIVEMTRDLEAPALVLLDEVGAGTDPTEGGALGVAIVEHFRRRGAMVVATTHHGLMKAYAQATPGVACASFGYDPQTYEPTYRLTLGAAGRSLALEMAERLGLPPEVIEDARARRDDKLAQAEALVERAERERAELERERVRLDAERLELEAAKARAAEAEALLRERKRREVAGFVRELRRRAEDAQRLAAEAVRAAVARVERERSAAAAEGARAEARRAIRDAERQALGDLDQDLAGEAEAAPAPIAVGARVEVVTLGVRGELIALHPDGEVEVAVGGKRLRVPRRELKPLPASGRAGARPAARIEAPAKTVAGEINLVGLSVDEALPRVDKLLDDAALSDRHEIRVIHGFGQGKLRRAVAQLLEGHPHVARWRAGLRGEGGGGVTIVELRE
jgi:DNA mismatch repair protein MutS2